MNQIGPEHRALHAQFGIVAPGVRLRQEAPGSSDSDEVEHSGKLGGSNRALAIEVETAASLNHRRFVHPLVQTIRTDVREWRLVVPSVIEAVVAIAFRSCVCSIFVASAGREGVRREGY